MPIHFVSPAEAACSSRHCGSRLLTAPLLGSGSVAATWIQNIPPGGEAGSEETDESEPPESVEGLVLRHFESAGWHGCHSENRLFLTLYVHYSRADKRTACAVMAVCIH